nr:MAG TPA: hypothetical protein [Bacteriophage sp.]
MKERKFKVGDRVVEKINQKKGIVVDFSRDYNNVLVKFCGWNEGHDGRGYTESGKTYYGKHCWYFCEEQLEMIKDETIVIYRKDNKVIALDKSTGGKAEANCNTADEFDFRTGAKLAFNRLMGEVVKTDNGVREVKRKAKVGEYIKVVNEKSVFNTYKNGEIFKVTYVTKSGCMCKNSEKQCSLWHEEYVVLENYKPEEKAQKENDSEIHVGDMVEVTRSGGCYSEYNTWSGLGNYRQNFVKGVLVEYGMIAKVLNIAKHDNPYMTLPDLALIQNPKTSQVFIIKIDGIKKVER